MPPLDWFCPHAVWCIDEVIISFLTIIKVTMLPAFFPYDSSCKPRLLVFVTLASEDNQL